ncbi:MAG: 50S ribosomal protein L29 [Candidatus Pacebacteria bacterium]|jgi:ribosomal protein L29|nr:50S ribosomal protein L29 [Candidatus Paceibacterota bacterium]
MTKKISFKDKKVEELETMLGEKREELRQTRFAVAGARPADSSLARKTRKDIARILTEMTAKITD